VQAHEPMGGEPENINRAGAQVYFKQARPGCGPHCVLFVTGQVRVWCLIVSGARLQASGQAQVRPRPGQACRRGCVRSVVRSGQAQVASARPGQASGQPGVV
jgi:hypothetical protein